MAFCLSILQRISILQLQRVGRVSCHWQVVVLALLGGLPYVVWGFVIRMLVTMHMTWFVNSAVHIWGRQTYLTNDSSRNNWCGHTSLRLVTPLRLCRSEQTVHCPSEQQQHKSDHRQSDMSALRCVMMRSGREVRCVKHCRICHHPCKGSG
jgi:hypothetical protein